MNARPGRPPKLPAGTTSTITLRLPAEIKKHLVEMSEALNMSMTEYMVTLVKRDIGG